MKKTILTALAFLYLGFGYAVIVPPENDLCTNATSILGSGTIYGSTSDATYNTTVITCGTSHTAPDVWYTFKDNSGTGYTGVVFNTCGSGFDTKITVFKGSCGALVCVTGNDDYCGLQSQVTFDTDGSSTYFIMVHGFSTAKGAFMLNISGLPDMPPVGDGPEINLNLSPLTGGSVDVYPLGPYEVGDVVTLTATANPPYVFSHWEWNPTSTYNPLVLTISDTLNITAYFTWIPAAQTPISGWAIYLGIFLIIGFLAVRFSRML